MLKIIKKIFKVGKPYSKFKLDADQTIVNLGASCKKIIAAKFNRSLAIRQIDAGSCNGCELEIHALNNVYYNLEQYGIHFVASPRHADILLVTGPVSRHMEAALRITYENTPDPKIVIAAGSCATDGGCFGKNYACCGAVSTVIPVDLVIPGCPPTPTDLLRGILQVLRVKALKVSRSKRRGTLQC